MPRPSERHSLRNRRRNTRTSGASDLTAPLLDLHAAMDTDGFWFALVDLMKAALPTSNIIAGLPFEGLSPMAMRTTLVLDNPSEYWRKVNSVEPPLARVIATQPGIELAVLDEFVPWEELQTTRFYREVMEPDGSRHLAGLLFWEHGQFTAHVGLARSAELGPYLPEEKSLLEKLHAEIAVAIRRVAWCELAKLRESLLRDALDQPVDGLVLLDLRLRPVFHNRAAHAACARWMGDHESLSRTSSKPTQLPLPPKILAAADSLMGQFMHEFHRKAPHPKRPTVEVAQQGKSGAIARIQVIWSGQSAALPHLRIEFSRADAQGRAVPVFRLTAAEQRVAALVTGGLQNDEVARELGLSIHTVRAHLRQIFDKLGIRNRGQLASALSEH